MAARVVDKSIIEYEPLVALPSSIPVAYLKYWKKFRNQSVPAPRPPSEEPLLGQTMEESNDRWATGPMHVGGDVSTATSSEGPMIEVLAGGGVHITIADAVDDAGTIMVQPEGIAPVLDDEYELPSDGDDAFFSQLFDVEAEEIPMSQASTASEDLTHMIEVFLVTTADNSMPTQL